MASRPKRRRHRTGPPPDAARLGALVARLGGRYSTELGLDLARPGDVERWFLAATLFGTRIGASIAMRTWRTLCDAGVCTVVDAGVRSWEDLVALLDAGGYTRYDFRTATRLQRLAAVMTERFGGRVSVLGGCADPAELEAALDALPGWGPVTVRVFLRELRGVWPGAQPPLDPRAGWAARHLRLTRARTVTFRHVARLADDAGVDARDAEAALIRLSLAHRGGRACPGAGACAVLGPARPPR